MVTAKACPRRRHIHTPVARSQDFVRTARHRPNCPIPPNLGDGTPELAPAQGPSRSSRKRHLSLPKLHPALARHGITAKCRRHGTGVPDSTRQGRAARHWRPDRTLGTSSSRGRAFERTWPQVFPVISEIRRSDWSTPACHLPVSDECRPDCRLQVSMESCA